VQAGADDHRRQEAKQNVGDEPLRLPVADQAEGDVQEALSIKPADGEDGAELDGDLEHLARRAAKAEEIDKQDEVAGGGDRDEFGKALDKAEECRREEVVDGINGGIPLRAPGGGLLTGVSAVLKRV
jgi:hypothetical protein